MMKPVETIIRGNKRAEIYYDELADSPRDNCDWLGTMVCGHRSYILGDEQICVGDYGSWEEVKQYLIDDRHAKVILPLSLYDHSGITMSVGIRGGWDCGQVGYIYVSEEDCIKEYGQNYSISKIEDMLRAEVEVYDFYLRNEVYGFRIFENKHNVNKCPHCNKIIDEQDDEEEIDACWGFYGMKDVMSAVEEVIG